MLKSMTGHLMVIFEGPNLSLKLVILVIMVKNLLLPKQLSSMTLDIILKLLQSPETQGIKYKKETITTFRISSTSFYSKSFQTPTDDMSLFCLYDDAFLHQVLSIKNDMSSLLLPSRIFFLPFLSFS